MKSPPGQALRLGLLTTLAMLAFAGNSLLCRVALGQVGMDAASFTAIRLASGAVMLWLLLRLRSGQVAGRGNWPSALALFAYAAAFSFAYEHLTAATGALVLFPVVQATMIGHGLWSGERLRALQWTGLAIALAGLVALLLPGVSAPPLHGALLMAVAGLAWGVYSLRGRGAGDPTAVTAGNFLRATVPAVLLLVVFARQVSLDASASRPRSRPARWPPPWAMSSGTRWCPGWPPPRPRAFSWACRCWSHSVAWPCWANRSACASSWLRLLSSVALRWCSARRRFEPADSRRQARRPGCHSR